MWIGVFVNVFVSVKVKSKLKTFLKSKTFRKAKRAMTMTTNNKRIRFKKEWKPVFTHIRMHSVSIKSKRRIVFVLEIAIFYTECFIVQLILLHEFSKMHFTQIHMHQTIMSKRITTTAKTTHRQDYTIVWNSFSFGFFPDEFKLIIDLIAWYDVRKLLFATSSNVMPLPEYI